MIRLFALAAIATVCSSTVSQRASAYDWSSRSAFMTEWQQQSTRIKDGRRSGMLSRAEARMLRRELDVLAGMPFNSTTCDMLSQHSKKIASYKSASAN